MAKDRTVYHVLPNGEEGWKAENVGNHKVIFQEKTKEEVVKKIKEKARGEEPSQVVVHGSDGNIQHESTYSDDPRRYKD